MQDAILAGTGNSRYLKSVSGFLSLYPTYEDFVQALIAGTLPVDLNGVNPEGWTELGTELNKANLLTDATAALVDLGPEATPNEVLAALANQQGTANTSLNSLKTKVNGLITYGTSDLTAGSSSLTTGAVYLVYK